jgi:hypothetical protein
MTDDNAYLKKYGKRGNRVCRKTRKRWLLPPPSFIPPPLLYSKAQMLNYYHYQMACSTAIVILSTPVLIAVLIQFHKIIKKQFSLFFLFCRLLGHEASDIGRITSEVRDIGGQVRPCTHHGYVGGEEGERRECGGICSFCFF